MASGSPPTSPSASRPAGRGEHRLLLGMLVGLLALAVVVAIVAVAGFLLIHPGAPDARGVLPRHRHLGEKRRVRPGIARLLRLPPERDGGPVRPRGAAADRIYDPRTGRASHHHGRIRGERDGRRISTGIPGPSGFRPGAASASARV